MAVAQRLPSGHIVLLLTPREATHISDELLDPQDFPWQSTEAQVTALEVRMLLRGYVADDAQDRVSDVAKRLEQQQPKET